MSLTRYQLTAMLQAGTVYARVVTGPNSGSVGVLLAVDNGSGKWANNGKNLLSWDGERAPKRLKMVVRQKKGRDRNIIALAHWFEILTGEHSHQFCEDTNIIPDIPDLMGNIVQTGNMIVYANTKGQLVISTVSRITKDGQVYVKDLKRSEGEAIKEERPLRSGLYGKNFLVVHDGMVDQMMILKLSNG